MRSIILAICLAGLVVFGPLSQTNTAVADSFYNGYVDGLYTFNDGYWWKDGVAFTRERQSYRYHDGCRVCVASRWIYTKYQAPEPVEQGPAYEGWRRDLLKIAEKQLQWDSDLKSSEQEQKEFLEAVKALGLDQRYAVSTRYPSNLTGNAYGPGNGYMLQGSTSSYTAPYAAQGSAVYGYDSVASVYPDVDLKVLYNQANNLARGVQDLAGQATGDFSALVSQTEGNRAEVARIIARGQAAAQVLQMLRDRPTTTTSQTDFTLKQGQDGSWNVVPAQPGDAAEAVPAPQAPQEPATPAEPTGKTFTDEDRDNLFAIIQAKCISCHGPSKKQGGLDMTKFLSMDAIEKQEVLARLVTEDADKLMPQAKGGGPGKPLAFDEISLFFRAAGHAGVE